MQPVFQTTYGHFYFVPAASLLKVVSGTFRCLTGYLFFIRGVLDISEDFPPSVNRMDYLVKNFQTALDLAGDIQNIYLFAGVVAPSNNAELEKANQFLMQGLKRRPQDWKIPFWIGFNYLQCRDYRRAIEFYQLAAKIPTSPSFLKTNLAYLYYRAGSAGEGIMYLEGLLASVENERLRRLLSQKISWLEKIVFLQQKVEEFFLIYKRWPETLEELKDKGFLKEIPEDNFGAGFYLYRTSPDEKPLVKSK
ncbi:MAG: hypothetical protein N2606_07180 [Candidatus Omnitrophica bacterium]|nr:hypothetical protein [Candidatus Omnitrophota bacterium]